MSDRRKLKLALLIVASTLFGVAFILAIQETDPLARWIAQVGSFVCFVGLFVADWQDELRAQRKREADEALSHERAKIVGDFVHRTQRRGGRRDA